MSENMENKWRNGAVECWNNGIVGFGREYPSSNDLPSPQGRTSRRPCTVPMQGRQANARMSFVRHSEFRDVMSHRFV